MAILKKVFRTNSPNIKKRRFIHHFIMESAHIREDRNISISYVTSVRYFAGINHEARGCVAPEGRVIYSGNVPNCGRDINNLCRHEPIAMINGAKFMVLSP